MSKIKTVLSKKIVAVPLVILVLALIIVVWKVLVTETGDYRDKYEGADLSVDIDGIARNDTYAKYLAKYEGTATPDAEVEVDLFDYLPTSQGVSVLNDVDGESQVLQSDETGFSEWKVDIPEAGMYSIYLEYYPVESRGIDIERAVYINGELPFYGADAITFSRVWADSSEIQKDNQGNDIRPTQVEKPIWQSSYAKDYMGYYVDPYMFYFEKGENVLRLEGVNEPLVLRKLVIKNADEVPTYEEYKQSIVAADYSDASSATEPFRIQGEEAQRRSSPSLYPTNDRASAITEPYSASLILMNKIGGNQWRVAGDWIEWDVEVPADGMYTLSVKGRQNYNRGFVSSRSITIDGECPFKECEVISFQFANGWQMNTLSDENGTPYEFALKKGTHTIRLEVTLGDLGDILTELSDSVFRLNAMYRKILVLTGASPDQYRDYKIDKVFPEVIESMDIEYKRLYKIVDDLIEFSGERGTQVSSILTVANQLEKFVRRPDKIPKSLGNFKENASAIGTGINSLSEAPLDIDYIQLTPAGVEVESCKESFLQSAMHEIRVFVASFVVDYTSLGNVYDDKDELIDCWMLSGRDQSSILKTMIDDTFVPEYGIGVNVKLIDATTLLPAVVAGTGPDVALTVAQTEPVNYALRNAAVNLTQFDDWEEWKTNVLEKEYYRSSYLSYEFNGGVYALPETQNFNVLFYRQDILDDLGVDIPETWDELLEILPTITNNNLEVGIPSTERKVGNTANPDLANYFCQLYQRGGKLYNEDGTRVDIDSEPAINAFEYFTKLFTNYKLPTSYDFVNRFRSGEMPIGIQDFSNYNTLVVFAPEIKGLWNFALVPGYEREDENGNKYVDRSVQSWGQCAMILTKDKKEQKYDLAWTFLKWWISSDTQVRFGRELESVMGSSARYATANKVAFEQLSWSKKDADVIKDQWEWAFGVPEIAGGYYTSRHITNAIRNVMNDNDDPRETILDYVRTINEEITNKRKEFGLPVIEED